MSANEALFLLCGYPVLLAVIYALICSFWRILELNARESDTKRFPSRPGTEPARPDRFKPYRRHPDMLTRDDKE